MFGSHCKEDMEEENTHIILTRKERRRKEWRKERKEKREE